MGKLIDLFDRGNKPSTEPRKLPSIPDATALLTVEDAARRLEVTIRYEKLETISPDDDYQIRSGACVVRGDRRLIIDRHLTDGHKWRIIAAILSRFDSESTWLPPMARQLIEGYSDDPTEPK